ncbi:MAG: PEP-CTERM sorting domain-containing protein [Alphaproteobacteria bacterium]|nr:PEP-CTERM sorting domain-containing protein [Alphaproteobacteria bacterium]
MRLLNQGRSHRILGIVMAAVGMSVVIPATATPFDPNDFASLGAVGGGALAIDTSAGTFNGNSGGVLFSPGGGAPDIAVFTFDGGSVLGDITVSGSNSLAILFLGSGTVAGTIDISGVGNAGGVGGRQGGVGGRVLEVDGHGEGPGRGLAGSRSPSNNGVGSGSGAGFGTEGQQGGAGITTRLGGAAYGDPISVLLDAGSGGGSGGFNTQFNNGGTGGAGGGALEIGASTTLRFAGASIFANGGDGGDGSGSGVSAGGGGGSGGGLLFHAFDIEIDALSLINANGGVGGNLGRAHEGGCGGAGRIEVLHNTAGSFSNSGVVEAKLGAGNSRFCNPDPAINVLSIVARDDIGAVDNNTNNTAVAEPATLALFGIGLIGLGVVSRQRNV